MRFLNPSSEPKLAQERSKVQSLQPSHAVLGLQLLEIMTRTNRGMRSLFAIVEQREFKYLLTLTIIIALAGAVGIYAFERKLLYSNIGITY